MLQADLNNNALTIRLSGHWTVDHMDAIETALATLPTSSVASINVNCRELQRSDLGPMWLLRTALQHYSDSGATLQYSDGEPEHFSFLNDLQAHTGSQTVAREATLLWPEKVVATFGKRAVELGHHALGHLEHFGRIISTEASALRQPKRFRIASVTRHGFETGIAAIPIVSMIA